MSTTHPALNELNALRADLKRMYDLAASRNGHFPKVIQENAALRAHVAALEKGMERLDWLIIHGAYLSHSRDGEVYTVWFSHDPDDDSKGAVPAEGYPLKCYRSAFAAIDNARAKEGTT